MSNEFAISLESDAQAVIAKIAGATGQWGKDALVAAQAVGKVIVAMIPSETDWVNPTPLLDLSFTVSARPYGAEAGSDLPYSRRREFGFSGKTDSLGRYYAHDPGAFYLQKTLQDLPSHVGDALNQLAQYMGIA